MSATVVGGELFSSQCKDLSFVVYVHPEPQGSAKAFVIGGKARVTTDNSKLKPFRSEVTRTALSILSERGIQAPLAGKHVPVSVSLHFVLAKPPSVPRRRTSPSVKPDLDKLIRSCLDSLTGVAFADDAQVVNVKASKSYGSPECVQVTISASAECA